VSLVVVCCIKAPYTGQQNVFSISLRKHEATPCNINILPNLQHNVTEHYGTLNAKVHCLLPEATQPRRKVKDVQNTHQNSHFLIIFYFHYQYTRLFIILI